MAEIIIGERVINKKKESGVIVYFDDKYINIQYNDRLGKLLINAFEEGYIQYENAELQNKVDEAIAQAKAEEERKEKERIAEEKAKAAFKIVTTQAPSQNNDIKFERVITLIDPAPVYLNSVDKNDRELVQEIFETCDKDTQTLYEAFEPKMKYPKLTSHSRSKYCVGYLSKYSGAYVLRVISRNDVYKKRVKTGITVMESNIAEVLRVIQIKGKLYHFTKNMSVSLGYYNNTIGNPKWRVSDMGARVFLNRVVCNCDCGYLNEYVSDNNLNTEAFLFIKLLFLALENNKSEIVFKNKAFASTYAIDNLANYLEEFTPKQIDFASKNDVLHALPFMKKYGVSDVQLLRDLDDVMTKRSYEGSSYDRLKRLIAQIGGNLSDLDKRLMNFIKNVEYFSAAIYNDYLDELGFLQGVALTTQDIFDRDYMTRHTELLNERLARYETNAAETEREDNEKYVKAANELSWIDREENGYFIMVPKTVKDFADESAAQHNCVYSHAYYNKVVSRTSVIVFLRRKKNTPFVTIEYDYNTFKVLQALGKFNKKIDPELYQYIVNLGKQLYYEMHMYQ
jgi:hypothetical protein